MKIRIAEREYDAVDPSTASLLHLMDLKTQTARLGLGPGGKGLGMAALQAIGTAAAAAQQQGETPEDGEVWMAVMVYLTRRTAGEDISFHDAIDVPLSSIEVVADPVSENPPEDVPDPTVPAATSPAVSGVDPA